MVEDGRQSTWRRRATAMVRGATVVAPESAARPLAARDDAHEAAADPARVGRFVVLSRLGEGGMGVVFAAFDERLDRKVAIKLRHEGALFGDEEVRTRMLREAQAMARLSHPNVVAVYEVDEHQGQIYVAMEFVRGVTLREWQESSARPWREIVAMYMQAAEGLKAAHAAGLVHRDFKPENVLVGEDGRARVVDFGLARDVGEGGPVDDPAATERAPTAAPTTATGALRGALTQQGALMGTPGYMSPEQFLGLSAGAPSDQFSLCVALYEALYGVPPFAGEEWTELQVSVTTGQLRPPPTGSPIPERLHRALVRGLEVDTGDRFPSVAALIAEVREIVDPSGAPARARRRWLAAIGAAILLLAGGGVALALSPAPPPAGTITEVDRLVESATEAASRTHWVFPGEEAPEATAYRGVLALEALGSDAGEDAAADLRAASPRRSASSAIASGSARAAAPSPATSTSRRSSSPPTTRSSNGPG
ncbi:MAG: serine/threonine-protein kinase [Nannocystaceae bacterium]